MFLKHDGCQGGFARLENLKIHIRSHTGDRPFKCKYNCNKVGKTWLRRLQIVFSYESFYRHSQTLVIEQSMNKPTKIQNLTNVKFLDA